MPRPKNLRSTSATKGYANGKRRTNLSVQGNLVDVATQYFPLTRHASLSGFLEDALRKVFRQDAPKIRKVGIKLPEELFSK